jgi:gliding motility-associated-like protein
MREDFVLWVPNSFTPNGDEFNNLLRAYAEGIDDYNFSFQIFNRWGELIWETKDIEQGWDGTYNGVVCQDGTYTWKIVVKDIYTDERRDFVGHVNLLK